MGSFRFCFLSAVICSFLAFSTGADPTTEPTKTIDIKNDTIIKQPTTMEEATTVEPITSTAEPITTSTEPITTTTEPIITTTEPIITTTEPNTTTTTTTTPAPPAPPKPAPGPPEQGLWTYTDMHNVTCVVVQFAAQLNVTYPMTINKTASVGILLMNIPANATVVKGSCDVAEQNLTISWPATVDKDHTLAIRFLKNETTKSYEVMSLKVVLVPSVFPNISNVDSIELYHGAEWQTPLAASYRCAAATKLAMTADAVNIAATLTVSRLQEEAFRTAAGTGFSAPRDCAGGDIPDAVPIAVGCALGGMVVVVLIAYLVARRRSAARGYLSM